MVMLLLQPTMKMIFVRLVLEIETGNQCHNQISNMMVTMMTPPLMMKMISVFLVLEFETGNKCHIEISNKMMVIMKTLSLMMR